MVERSVLGILLELVKVVVEIWLLGIITHSQLSCLDGVLEMLQMKGPHFSSIHKLRMIALQIRMIMRELDNFKEC